MRPLGQFSHFKYQRQHCTKHTTIEPKTNGWGNYVNNVSSLLVIHLSMWNTPRRIPEVWFAMYTWSVTVVVTWLLVIITDSFTCTLRNIGIQFGIILILKNKWRQKTWNERCTIRHTSVKSATPGIPLIEHLVSNSGYSFHLLLNGYICQWYLNTCLLNPRIWTLIFELFIH